MEARKGGGGAKEVVRARRRKSRNNVLSIQRESGNGTKNTRKKRHLKINKKKHVWLSGRLYIEGRLNEGPRLQRKRRDENEAKQNKRQNKQKETRVAIGAPVHRRTIERRVAASTKA